MTRWIRATVRDTQSRPTRKRKPDAPAPTTGGGPERTWRGTGAQMVADGSANGGGRERSCGGVVVWLFRGRSMKGRGQSPPTVAPRAKRLGPSVARGRAEGGARSEGGTTPKGAKGRVYLITRERKCKTPSLLIIYYLFFYPPHLLGFIDGVAIEGAQAPERGRA